MRRPEVMVAWAYDQDAVTPVSGPEREELLARVGTFLDGQAPPFSHFDLGEFRDPDRRVLLVVEESC